MKNRLPILLLLGLLFSASGCSTNISSLVPSSEPASSSEASSSASSSKSSSSSKGTSSEAPSSQAPSSEDKSEPAPTSSEAPSSQAPSSEAPSSEAPSSEAPSSQAPSSEAPSSEAPTSEDTSASVSIPPEDAHWDLDFTEYGKTFMVTLGKQIVNSGKVTSYSDQKTIGPKAAAYPNENSSTFIPFYLEPKAENAMSSSMDIFDKPEGWNREHTWPKSRGGEQMEKDAVMVRPAAKADNSNRGNKFYGTGSSEWDPAGCGYEHARGEAARVILYCATAYNGSVSLSNNPSDGSSKNTMGTLKTLLKWNRDYAPTEWERTVNERLDKYGYRRNPFVDHPEYANWIWDDNGLRTTPYSGDVPTPTSSSSTSAEATSHDDTKALSLVTDLLNLDGKKFVITNKYNDQDYSLIDQCASEKLPWYLNGNKVTIENGKLYSESDLVYFTFEEVQQDTYNIFAPDGRALYGYKAGTHYSIGLVNSEQEIRDAQGGTEVTAISKDWSLDIGTGGAFQMTAAGVFFRFHDRSFKGYSQAPENPIMLFA